MHIPWDDLQTIEALVRTGSVEAAGRELSLRHSTVSRRVAALEARLGAALFARGPRLVPTELARKIASGAEAMRAAAGRIDELVGSEQRQRESTIVVTTSDVLVPLLCAAIARCDLGRTVRIVATDDELELLPGRVDLALRPRRSPRGSLRGRRLGTLAVGVYGGPTRAPGWVLPSAALREKSSMRWWRHVPEAAHGAVVVGSLLAMRDACRAGLGRAALPSVLAYDDDRLGLERTIDGGPPLWLLAPAGAGAAATDVAARLATALRSIHGVFVG